MTKHDQLRSLLERRVVARTSIMVGDRAVDIEAARASGLGAIGVLWGYGTEAELLAVAPDRILGRPAERTDEVLATRFATFRELTTSGGTRKGTRGALGRSRHPAATR